MPVPEGKFNQLHYNFVAKRLRLNFERYLDDNEYSIRDNSTRNKVRNACCSVVVNIAMDFAESFREDNPSFDPLVFLDQCSPNTDMYPLSELWESGES